VHLVEPQDVPAGEHSWTAVPGKEATCTEPGLTEGEKCAVCGEISIEQEVIDALGHKEETIPGKEPTATEPGLTEGKKCSVCGTILVEQEEIPAIGCKHAETTSTEEIVVKATCITDGSKKITVVCVACGETVSETTENIPATGKHSYDNPLDTTCNNCTHTREVDEFKIIGKNVKVTEGKSIKKIQSMFIFYHGWEKVADINNFELCRKTGLKYTLYPSGYRAFHQLDHINSINLRIEGNYVLLMQYIDENDQVQFYAKLVELKDLPVISVTPYSYPTGAKVSVDRTIPENTLQKMYAFYLGDEMVENIYTFGDLLAVGSKYDVFPGGVKYINAQYMNNLKLTVEGNYVLLVEYLLPTGDLQYVSLATTVKAVPTITLDDNKVLIDKQIEANTLVKADIFFVGDTEIKVLTNYGELAAAARKYPAVYNGQVKTVQAQWFGNIKLPATGEYVVLLTYIDSAGNQQYAATRVNCEAVTY
jgi:hypothetical protein